MDIHIFVDPGALKKTKIGQRKVYLKNVCAYIYECEHTHRLSQGHTYLSNSLIKLNMMTGFWSDLQAEDKASFYCFLPFPSSLSSSNRMNGKDW